MSDVGAQLLAELRGVKVEDLLAERRHRRRSLATTHYRYRGRDDVQTDLDWLDRPKLVRRDLKTSNDWEAMQVALYRTTIEALADAAGVSVSRVVRALEGFEPTPAGYPVRRCMVRPFSCRAYW